MQDGIDRQGYSRASIYVHWISAILVLALFFTHEASPGSFGYMLHVSGGAIAGVFLLWRVWNRARRGMAAKASQAAVLNLAAKIVTWGFLAAVTVVVITGYLLPWTKGQALDMFGLFAIPSPMAQNHGLHEFVEEAHELSGHLFVTLLALHVLGTFKHALIDRDGSAMRMFRAIAGGC